MGSGRWLFLRLKIERDEDLRFSFFNRSLSFTASTGERTASVVDFPLTPRPKVLIRLVGPSGTGAGSSGLSFLVLPADLSRVLFSLSFEDNLCLSLSLDLGFLSLSLAGSSILRSLDEAFLSADMATQTV